MSEDDPSGPGRPRRGPVVRPYAITGGRARPTHDDDLEVEALVSTTLTGEVTAYLTYEQRGIIRLCQEVRSVAELSAGMEMPLGVVRVLVTDMADEGLVTIHRPSELLGDHPDLSTLERVLSSLRSL